MKVNVLKRLFSTKLVNPIKIQEKIDKLPYFIERTKVGKNLPVYTDYRYNGQKISTIIRRIYGSIHALEAHLKATLPKRTEIEIRPDMGQIKIKGNYHARLKEHFTRMGF